MDERYNSPVILVTGATGFLGSHVAEALLARGEAVRLLARRPEAAAWLVGRGAQCVAGDLSSAAALAAAVRGCRAVVHCAALAADWGPWQAFREANDHGVARLLEACRDQALARFVHISTADVYGYPDCDGLDEATPWRDRGFPYNSTKIAGERHAQAAQRAGLPVTVIRPGNIYGPRSISFGSELVAAIKSGAPLIRGGRVNAGLVYVDNVVALILMALDQPAAVGATFHSVDDDGHTWREYFTALCRGLDLPLPQRSLPRSLAYALATLMEWGARARRQQRRPLLTRTAVELLGTRQGFSMARARRQLGFVPAVGFEEGLARTVAWLRTQSAPGSSTVTPVPPTA
ncbi:MAG: NAD-dependent epimerase/dehydratase family protein [Deltaproteobacteria bacterium]|nr:NAD-dependent epimerase/dehydratase family protein [Deltaproteobacteria bacterium]